MPYIKDFDCYDQFHTNFAQKNVLFDVFTAFQKIFELMGIGMDKVSNICLSI